VKKVFFGSQMLLGVRKNLPGQKFLKTEFLKKNSVFSPKIFQVEDGFGRIGRGL